ncbi:MAG: GNAT family N-acetyltransferase [Planctomycetaceae bacterium]|nr:GNAT family N-acetyltransferase [Planctomycetaceae bacterium]
MSAPQALDPLTLRGRLVALEPLALAHVDELWPAAEPAQLWEVTSSRVTTKAELERYVREALEAAATGRALPFVTRRTQDGRAIGSTRFAAYEPAHARVEIGWTFLHPSVHGSGANVEAKLLQFRHAFETLALERVELKTDLLNLRSQRAMERLGLVREGVLRRHMVVADGRVRDTVYYSAIRSEWPELRARLEALLAR